MEIKFLLEKIQELLNLNKGIFILICSEHSKYCQIEFQIRDSHTRLQIVHAAYAANMNLDMWVYGLPSSEEATLDPDAYLRYRLRNYRNENDYEDPIEAFSQLGAHLTWEMYSSGVINSKSEQSFCEVFNAISRSA